MRNPRTDWVHCRSILASNDEALLKASTLLALRCALREIDARFRTLYSVKEGKAFAIEVEFKVTKEGALLIK